MNYLKFTFHSDYPELHINNWKQIKSELYPFNIKKTNLLLEEVKNNCNILFNKNLPILKRNEGLLGGDSNINNKQIRLIPEEYLHNYPYYKEYSNIKPILISYFNSSNKNEIWLDEDLLDIIESFKKTLYNILNRKCNLNDTSLYVEAVKVIY